MLRTTGAGGSLQKDIWSTVPGGGTPVFFGGKKAMMLQTKWKEEQQSTGTIAVTGAQWPLCVVVICYISSVWFRVASSACLSSRNFRDSNN